MVGSQKIICENENNEFHEHIIWKYSGNKYSVSKGTAKRMESDDL